MDFQLHKLEGLGGGHLRTSTLKRRGPSTHEYFGLQLLYRIDGCEALLMIARS